MDFRKRRACRAPCIRKMPCSHAMNKERIQELAKNPEFIPGIYNYCDHWCERCPFIARCLNFALSQEQFAEPESRDIYNQLFWQRLTEMFHFTREMLEETFEQKGMTLSELDFSGEDNSDREAAANHECSRIAGTYGEFVDTWFEANSGFIQKRRYHLRINLQNRPNNREVLEAVADFEDGIEVIRWYQHQIYVKCMRAVSGCINEGTIDEKNCPKDSDGSAKVALIGIDRSISAWMMLRTYLPDCKDGIIDVLVHLDRLRKKIESHFPQARTFIRPGFDETHNHRRIRGAEYDSDYKDTLHC